MAEEVNISESKIERVNSFEKAMKKMIGTNDKAYRRYPNSSDPVFSDFFNIEKIKETLAYGEPSDLRELSRFAYRYFGIYERVINYYSRLLLFDYVTTPKVKGNISKNKILTKYNNVLSFLDKMNIPVNFQYITFKILKNGAYYGLFRVFNDGITFQELPVEYCRSRYKDSRGIDILEFNLSYFRTISSDLTREEILNSFPKEVTKQWEKIKNGKSITDTWIELDTRIGVVFHFGDFIPYFVNAIPELLRLDEAQDREGDREAEELQKLLINKIPINNKTGEMVFEPEEAAVMHSGLVDMLSDNKYIDVLTTYGETSLEQAQTTTSQTQSNSLNKFTANTFDNLGASAQLFNAEGNTALKYSTDKDTSLMFSLAMIYANWLTYIVNDKFSDNKISFDIEFLPTTIHNRKDLMDVYLKGAQYGYSKIYTGVAQGIKQSNLVNLISLENDLLNLTDKMIPLSSSHTLTNDENSQKSAGKSKNATNGKDNNSEPGRPELSDSDKSDKTIANRDAM